MGVDYIIKVRLFKDGSDDYKEVDVSDQDNSLASIFHTKWIKYTNIEFDRHLELSAEENAIIELTDQDEDGMVACSEVVDAKDLLKVFNTIDRKLRKQKREALNNDLNMIHSQILEAEEKEQRKKSVIGEYLGFEGSFSTLEGILKTAVVLNFKAQIVAQAY